MRKHINQVFGSLLTEDLVYMFLYGGAATLSELAREVRHGLMKCRWRSATWINVRNLQENVRIFINIGEKQGDINVTNCYFVTKNCE